ncbi:uncharacterized protein K452DRAFT_289367 [Aplosporella prunicola CBS 121167]|uniref:Uncharacterized protein n=1 Tax=Aplosporella prunicola CBS 121167 TaxID=1176127 RepID=A0A6A6B9J8_9PEZI|nr:uncharacterized protein K452DRAFT_289367 [Aplosporella prunicola CBS 121167]KAF2139985.1 hypothetical protein K452DRAFT_289367 [Aplosporella prunicola CBS 121167]
MSWLLLLLCLAWLGLWGWGLGVEGLFSLLCFWSGVRVVWAVGGVVVLGFTWLLVGTWWWAELLMGELYLNWLLGEVNLSSGGNGGACCRVGSGPWELAVCMHH